MAHKGVTRPHCRFCGKAIAKYTVNNWVEPEPRDTHRPNNWTRYVYHHGTPLTSKADCQRHSNNPVVSVQYNDSNNVRSFSTWDGETYRDPYFCSGKCAQQFAYMMARTYPTKGTIEWVAAVANTKQRKAS